MPGISRKTQDKHIGHASPTPNPFHRTSYAQGSGNVIVNGTGAVRIGDTTGCGDPATAGSAKVIVNNIKVHRIGDATGGHGSWVPNASSSGSANVIAGDGGELSFGSTSPFASTNNFPTNIQPRLTPDEVPEGHPLNSEQIDPGEIEPPVNCGDVPFVNPYDIAAKALGLGDTAWRETGSNINITALWDEIGYNGAQYADETAWCAVFVGAILKRSSSKFIKTASSRAYGKYGIEVPIENLQKGDIVVFFRKGISSVYGHVGFATGIQTSDTIEILGGNQGDTLSVRTYSKSRPSRGWGIVGVRRAINCSDESEAPPALGETVASAGEGDKVT